MVNAESLLDLKRIYSNSELNYDHRVPAKVQLSSPVSSPDFGVLSTGVSHLYQETKIRNQKLTKLDSVSSNLVGLLLLGAGTLSIYAINKTLKSSSKSTKLLQTKNARLPQLKEDVKKDIKEIQHTPELKKGERLLKSSTEPIAKQKESIKVSKSLKSTNVASDTIKDFIKNKEGLRLKAYKLGGENKYTIGYGHSKGDVTDGMIITKAQAEQFFEHDIKSAENTIKRLVKVPLTQNQFDSLVSLVFNVGEGAFAKSKLLKKLNSGDYKGAATEFSDWVYGSNKQKLQGLVTRRKQERDLFESDIGKMEIKLIESPAINLGGVKSQTQIEPYTPLKKVELPKPIQTIQTSEGTIPIAQIGGKIGGYNLSTSEGDAKVTPWAKKYLSELGGNAGITSGARDWGAKGQRSHQSGNKLDFQIYSNMTDDKIISVCIPIMRHPATREVAFECLVARDSKLSPSELHKGNAKATAESNRRAKEIVNKIFNQFPDIRKKVQQRKLIIHTDWGWKFGSGPHLDVLISKDMLLKDDSYSLANINETKGNTQIKVAHLPDDILEDEIETNSSKTVVVAHADPNISTRIDLGKIGEIDLARTYQNTYV